jgi:hypothetical protein
MAVHGFLRRVYFDNVRQWGGGAALATLAAFAGSAALHEALIYNLSLHVGAADARVARAGLGSQTAFFVAQAVLCYAERAAARALPRAAARVRALPRAAQALLTAAAITPLGHLFTAPLLDNGLMASLFAHTPHLRLVAAS